jgi:hypothetical protein
LFAAQRRDPCKHDAERHVAFGPVVGVSWGRPDRATTINSFKPCAIDSASVRFGASHLVRAHLPPCSTGRERESARNCRSVQH